MPKWLKQAVFVILLLWALWSLFIGDRERVEVAQHEKDVASLLTQLSEAQDERARETEDLERCESDKRYFKGKWEETFERCDNYLDSRGLDNSEWYLDAVD